MKPLVQSTGVNLITLRFPPSERERKFTRESASKAINTVRVALILLCCAVALLLVLEAFYEKDDRWRKQVLLDGVFIACALLMIGWSYLSRDYFVAVLKPLIGLGVFVYMVVNVWLHKGDEVPVRYMMAMVALFMLKVTFRFVASYCILFLLCYQPLMLVKSHSGKCLLSPFVPSILSHIYYSLTTDCK